MNDPMLHPTAERLQGFLEGLLDEAERGVLESHLLTCTSCQTEVAEWRSLFTVLATLPQHAPSKGFANRVMAHVALPDPWYVRTGVRIGAQLQRFTPRTTRGWATATAFLALPVMIFGGLAAWILSKPYITPQGLVSYGFDRTQAVIGAFAQTALSTVLQSDAALFVARGLESVSQAGAGAAGALAVGIAMATAVSAWVLYQNLFRPKTTRGNNQYVSYSF